MDQEELYIRKVLKSAEASAAIDGGREAAELLGAIMYTFVYIYSRYL